MRGLLAGLWRVRLAIAAVLLAISAAAIVRGHHDVWAGNKFYTASLKDDLGFVGSTVLAFGALWIGAYSPAYVVCLGLLFAYQAILNVFTLNAGGFILQGTHGCLPCIEHAQWFTVGMIDYIFAGLFATAATRIVVARFTAHEQPGPVQADIAFLILLVVAWFKHTFYLYVLNQPAYVTAQLLRLSPYLAAALLATALTASVVIWYGPYQEPPRHVPQRVAVTLFLIIGEPLLALMLYLDSLLF